ncbi:DUF3137 domain-containing protein [Shewanella rhizosphaerae]|uniref:DUF3137 domain-containing protein n=1 Tax=Shewanella rhizosphaerae TaxID=2864207 RepID=UPI001C654BAE|nr:DUF3137 domain-containing protein [Shewanella rhizosphaerae]QYK14369.1 DUF3137 domain-containing protein [Shewanella rhizosphaerae]
MNPMEFAIPAEDKQAFSQYYAKQIAPRCRRYESARQAAAAKYLARRKISAPVTLIGLPVFLAFFALSFYGAIVLDFEDGVFYIGFAGAFLSIVAVASVIIWASSEINQLRTKIVDEIYPLLLGYFGKSFELNPSNLPELDAYKDYGLFPKYDKGYFDDSVKGKYHNVPFLMRELTLLEYKGTKDNKPQYKTLFEGVLIEFTLLKKFSGNTLVRQDKGVIGNSLVQFKQKLTRVKLEDPTFEREFQVYSDDQVEARYLLNTATMERMLSLSRFYRGELEASFKDGRLLIKIACKHNYFEPKLDLLKPLDFVDDIEQVFKEIYEVFDLIKALNLDSRTGL